MLNIETTGGPAYPSKIDGDSIQGTTHYCGITLIDVFAMAALQTLRVQILITPSAASQLAQSAYNMADAMLAESKKRKQFT